MGDSESDVRPRRRIPRGIVWLGVLFLAAVVVAYVVHRRASPGKQTFMPAIDAFMDAVNEEDYEKAYSLAWPVEEWDFVSARSKEDVIDCLRTMRAVLGPRIEYRYVGHHVDEIEGPRRPLLARIGRLFNGTPSPVKRRRMLRFALVSCEVASPESPRMTTRFFFAQETSGEWRIAGMLTVSELLEPLYICPHCGTPNELMTRTCCNCGKQVWDDDVLKQVIEKVSGARKMNNSDSS